MSTADGSHGPDHELEDLERALRAARATEEHELERALAGPHDPSEEQVLDRFRAIALGEAHASDAAHAAHDAAPSRPSWRAALVAAALVVAVPLLIVDRAIRAPDRGTSLGHGNGMLWVHEVSSFDRFTWDRTLTPGSTFRLYFSDADDPTATPFETIDDLEEAEWPYSARTRATWPTRVRLVVAEVDALGEETVVHESLWLLSP